MFVVLFDLGKSLGPLVLRGLSGEQPDWGSFCGKMPHLRKISAHTNSLSQKSKIFASSLKTREPRALPRRSNA